MRALFLIIGLYFSTLAMAASKPIFCKGAGFDIQFEANWMGWGNGYKLTKLNRNGRLFVRGGIAPFVGGGCSAKKTGKTSVKIECGYAALVELKGTFVNIGTQKARRGSIRVSHMRMKKGGGLEKDSNGKVKMFHDGTTTCFAGK